jgi:integrase/recombinase XerD
MGQLLELWVHDKAPETQRAYRRDVAEFVAIAGVTDPGEVRLADLHAHEDALRDRGAAPASVRRSVNAVKSLLTFAHRTGAIPYNVGAVKRAPRVVDDPDARSLPLESVFRLVAAAVCERSALIIRMLYYTGARVEELSALCWRDIRPRADRAAVRLYGKGDRLRFALIPAWLYAKLVAYRGAAGDDERIFASSSRALRRIVSRCARRANLPAVSPHWLRHSHASHALDRGAPAHLVQRTLGHSSLTTTGRYTHSRPDDSSGLYLPAL